jgi:hypothetical protein
MENTRVGKASQLVLPENGKYTITDWAEILGCSVPTVRINLKKYDIKTIRCGGTIVIVAEWWWAALLIAGGGDDGEDEEKP